MVIEIALGIVLGVLILRFLPQILVTSGYVFSVALALAILGGGIYAIYFGFTNYPKDILQISIAAASIALICFAINYISTAYIHRKINLGIYQSSTEASKALGEKVATGFAWVIFYIPIVLVFSLAIIAIIYKAWFLEFPSP